MIPMAISQSQTLIFTYGTLKRGFPNHSLLQDLMLTNDASFIGVYRTVRRLPLVRGPHGVPFLLNLPDADHHLICGELYSVSDRGLDRIDELEGISIGHYERHQIEIRPEIDPAGEVLEAEAYFAHRSFETAMWKRNGSEGLEGYTEEEAKGYVKRNLRPKDRTFLEDIQLFVSSSMISGESS
ncbi:putative gamma-glutamylcyclotransferase At3g02910 [Impatiens glandulifera]|uniref:putative gamma-glutamylcyclotransferase At3g02910 n=1 Tax=Impatiens glandulifera TaxID=253017 RepID=UPI001FB1902B|nr:putative gamma-glutamylcyclotransferase At3g02910 [Impatiens glandulifera]